MNMPLNTFAALVLAIAAAGCVGVGSEESTSDSAHAARSRRYQEALSVWRNPRSSAGEREAAVLVLIPVHASLDRTMEILGHPNRISNMHGPIFRESFIVEIDGLKYWEPGVQSGFVDEDLVEYVFKGGVVSLRFAPVGPDSRWEDERFLGVESGVNSYQLTPLAPLPDQ